MNVTAVVLMLAGAYTLLGGLLGWNWFMNSRKAAWIVRIIGPQGARLFYMIVGVVLLVLGVLTQAGRISPGSS